MKLEHCYDLDIDRYMEILCSKILNLSLQFTMERVFLLTSNLGQISMLVTHRNKVY